MLPKGLFLHGTNQQASTTITHAGRDGYSCRLTGIWNVGGGNYAGNGIYFAPARSTALHYARGSLIVCRVSLGKVLDLGLAPNHIFKQCGYPNTLGATKWGLQNGQRIPGGMCHWLFRKLVINDIMTYLDEKLE